MPQHDSKRREVNFLTGASKQDPEFDLLFQKATGHEPYNYQRTLALGETLPEVVIVPTGAGKTAAVIMAWIWRRRFASEAIRQITPRRLVICLPMRTLVSQTASVARDCLSNLGLIASDRDLDSDSISVHIVMGGEADDSWARSPERDTVLVGTQDMLLSRALNRGYGTSRFRWPALFGLLNNDSLWVFDEVQLMGSGLYTSVQIQAFRERYGVFGTTKSIWMSATAEPKWLATVNRLAPRQNKILTLTDEDAAGPLKNRLSCQKRLQKGSPTFVKDLSSYASEVARVVSEHHRAGTLTLVVVNTVARATAIYKALSRLNPPPPADLMLLHSRFRSVERDEREERLKTDPTFGGKGRIVVSTQVVEAGMDIDAATLVTEIAPWGSMVQRFGRANRAGKFQVSDVIWIDVQDSSVQPYVLEDIAQSRRLLQQLEGCSVAPADLPKVSLKQETGFALRRRDFDELFDTTPDIGGTLIDVSRFVRGQDDPDVRVFWREWKGSRPPPQMPAPDKREICAVPAYEVKRLLDRASDRWSLWRWDHVEGVWNPVRSQDVVPGQDYMIPSSAGGYNHQEGWNPGSQDPVSDIRIETASAPDSIAAGYYYSKEWVSLSAHSLGVAEKTKGLLAALPFMDRNNALALEVAAMWHDVGKAHHVFQEAMLASLEDSDRPAEQGFIAKRPARFKRTKYARPLFRHELASALAVLKHLNDPLVAYLVASHHGKVRGTIRALPAERRPPHGRGFAMGVWEGDELPALELGGLLIPKTVLDLEPMELGLSASGTPSWFEQVAGLVSRKDLGPLRLAYLEALLVAADWAASAEEGGDKVDADDAHSESFADESSEDTVSEYGEVAGNSLEDDDGGQDDPE